MGNYRKYIEGFVTHIDQESRGLSQIDHGVLLRWMQKIRLTGVQERSLQGNKSAVSSWYEWLVRIGKVERNPIKMLAAIKVKKTIPKPLTTEETSLILTKARELRSNEALRNVAILEVLYTSGIRRAELCGLDLTDLKLEGDTPHIVIRAAKGNREAIALVGRSAVEAIKGYLPSRARLCRRLERPGAFAAVFVSRRGERLEGRQIYKIVVDLGWKILGKKITPHQFRHSFATDLLNNGADLMSIKELMRHATLQSTEKYLAVSKERLKAQYMRHPRA